MSATEPALPLQAPPRPSILRSHQVRTLAHLQASLGDLITVAADRGHTGPINLADFDPTTGVNVSLNDDGAGNLSIAFRRQAR